MRVNKSLLSLTLALTLFVTLGHGHIVYDEETSQIVAQNLDLEKFFQLQGEISEIATEIEPLKGLSLEVKRGIKELFVILNNLLSFFGSNFQYTCPGSTCKIGKKCIFVFSRFDTYDESANNCQDRGGQIYIPTFPPHLPDFTEQLPNSCPHLLSEPVWFGNYHIADDNYYLLTGLIIPGDLYDTTPGGTNRLRDSGDANSTVVAPKSDPTDCDNLVLDLTSEPASTPFYCPVAGDTFKPLCEFDAQYQTFNGGDSIDTIPTDEEVENVKPHEVHKMLRSGLEFVSFLGNELKKRK